jgi:hypothetical protein
MTGMMSVVSRRQQQSERMMELQRSIDGHSPIQVNLLDSPSRRLIRTGALLKHGSTGGGQPVVFVREERPSARGRRKVVNSSGRRRTMMKWMQLTGMRMSLGSHLDPRLCAGSGPKKKYECWLFTDMILLARPAAKFITDSNTKVGHKPALASGTALSVMMTSNDFGEACKPAVYREQTLVSDHRGHSTHTLIKSKL